MSVELHFHVCVVQSPDIVCGHALVPHQSERVEQPNLLCTDTRRARIMFVPCSIQRPFIHHLAKICTNINTNRFPRLPGIYAVWRGGDSPPCARGKICVNTTPTCTYRQRMRSCLKFAFQGKPSRTRTSEHPAHVLCRRKHWPFKSIFTRMHTRAQTTCSA